MLLGLIIAFATGAGVLTGSALANHEPTSKDIPNLGIVETQIKTYYGDYVAADGTHQSSSNSSYYRETHAIETAALNTIKKGAGAKPAVVFDVDDTTLLTYNYEVANGFAYIPAVNAQYVLGEKFPAVAGMPTLVSTFKSRGVAIFFVTGRPQAQHAATLGNLAKVGYPTPTVPVAGEDGLYTKPDSGTAFPSYVDCTTDGDPACSTTEYKSSTRKHIESLGYDIIGNFGDQFSDLNGGFSDNSIKMPNPMYYLP
jgi:predicted secreted acid phosphatase